MSLCSPDGGAGVSCFPQFFEATAKSESLTIPVAPFEGKIAGLTVVDAHLEANGRLDTTPVTGRTQISVLFDGAPPTCTQYPFNNGTELYLRCQVPVGLGAIEFTCSTTAIPFSFSWKFTEPRCSPPWVQCTR
jgi:hypothetical protein